MYTFQVAKSSAATSQFLTIKQTPSRSEAFAEFRFSTAETGRKIRLLHNDKTILKGVQS